MIQILRQSTQKFQKHSLIGQPQLSFKTGFFHSLAMEVEETVWFPRFFPDSIGLIGKLNQFGEKHKSATLQNFATIARRSSTAVLNSGFWPLDDAALLNRLKVKVSSFPQVVALLLHSPKSIDFFKMYWNFRANQ